MQPQEPNKYLDVLDGLYQVAAVSKIPDIPVELIGIHYLHLFIGDQSMITLDVVRE
jgi:hypothetical protein